MNKSILFSAVLSVCSIASAFAQDAHFSQFYNASTFNNPAFIGAFQGSMRGSVIYRGQWSSILDNNAFRTVAGNFDTKLKVSASDYMAFGLNVMNDQSGVANYNIFRSHLGASYQKKINGGRRRYSHNQNDQFVNAGFQIGAGQHRFDQNIWFSNQYNSTTGQVDNNANSGEPVFNRSSNMYLDINAGLLWYAILGDNKSLYAGGSLLHANAPALRFRQNQSFSEVIKWRWVAQIGAELPFSDQMSILPAVIYQKQGPSQMTVFGANLRYNNRDWREVALRMGSWLRVANRLEKGQNVDALIFSAILETEKLHYGLSYDINVSKLQAASNFRGAFELSVTYIQPQERRRVTVNCPRF